MPAQTASPGQRTLTVEEGSLCNAGLQLNQIEFNFFTTYLQITTYLEKSKVKLETSHKVIIRPMVSVLCLGVCRMVASILLLIMFRDISTTCSNKPHPCNNHTTTKDEAKKYFIFTKTAADDDDLTFYVRSYAFIFSKILFFLFEWNC